MLKKEGQLKFEHKWPHMRPIVIKLFKQEPVTPAEYQELFHNVHLVCLWDEKGPIKLRELLHEDIYLYVDQVQNRVLAQRNGEALLKAYIVEWRKFFGQCDSLSTIFRFKTGLYASVLRSWGS